jgi:hypothetical protein
LRLVLCGTQLKHPRQSVQRHLSGLLLGSTLAEHAQGPRGWRRRSSRRLPPRKGS